MKKLILISSLFLVGCGYAPIDSAKSIVIKDIETAMGGESCNYYGRGNKMAIWTITEDDFKFRDTCGKFQIGDTIRFVKK